VHVLSLCVCFLSAHHATVITLSLGSYDQSVRVWDLKSHTRTPIQVINCFSDSVTSVVLSRDEIVTGCVDGAVRIFDVRAGRLRVDNVHGK
jgi:mitogen-activated protein kinase organizer 1